MAHGYCLLWQPWLVALYAGSDLLIFAAYSAIPIALLQVARRRPPGRYRGLVILFAAFILLCGLTHLLSVFTLWVPIYPLHGVVKLATGLVSAATAVVLFVMVPTLVRMPSPEQMEQANARLREEIAAHERTLAQLRESQRTLEAQVRERTGDLSEANRKLSVVSREAVHRAQNLLGVVASMARQTAREAPNLDVFAPRFEGRLNALSNATRAVLDRQSAPSASLEEVARRQLDPVLQTYGERVTLEGPPVEVGPEAAQQFALALHELATNAVKHGALAEGGGAVALSWRLTDGAGAEHLEMEWLESGGAVPGAAGGVPHEGFGTRLLTEAVPAMLDGEAERQISDGTLRYRLTVPLSAVAPRSAA